MPELTEQDYVYLGRMLEYEDKHEKEAKPEDYWLGWEWHQVSTPLATINKFITMQLVERTFSSNSTKAHKLTLQGKAMALKEIVTIEEPAERTAPATTDLSNMFNDIIGYPDIKELLRECLQLEKPIHVLLEGPPAMAKSLFLWDIERVWGMEAMWMVGSATSRAGLWDAVAEKKPRILLIDELDKMPSAESNALLTLMETGRLVRTKVHRQLDIQLTVWVVACANRTYNMSGELLSRFKVKKISEYNAVEFRNVVTSALVSHEGVTTDIAAEIAMRLVGKTHDVRDAVRTARLSKRVGVVRAVELLIGM